MIAAILSQKINASLCCRSKMTAEDMRALPGMSVVLTKACA